VGLPFDGYQRWSAVPIQSIDILDGQLRSGAGPRRQNAHRQSVGETIGGRDCVDAARQVSIQRALRLGAGSIWSVLAAHPHEPRRREAADDHAVLSVCRRCVRQGGRSLSIFRHSTRGAIVRYGAGQAPDKEGAVMFTDFMLESQWFAAMESAHEHKFKFNEAISLMVNCDTQEEIDYYWEKLSAVPEAEQCGWLKDKFGISWQIVPAAMDTMMRDGNPGQIARVTQAFLKMKKFDLAALRKAYQG
jgi:predicted 3-demethylubiquinone-9 3-methyltransferase (glyoxalase superfamily)